VVSLASASMERLNVPGPSAPARDSDGEQDDLSLEDLVEVAPTTPSAVTERTARRRPVGFASAANWRRDVVTAAGCRRSLPA